MVSEDRVTIYIDVDSTDANTSIDDVKEKADAATREWRMRRLEIIQGIRETISLMSQAWGTFRQFVSLVGGQIDPFYGALIGMTLSTISMMLSLASALSTTVVGVPYAIILGAVAIELNVLMMGKLIKDKLDTMSKFSTMKAVTATDLSGLIGGNS